MADEEDSNILLSHIGDKPSHIALFGYGTEGDGNEEEEDADWLLLQLLLLAQSNIRLPDFTDERWLAAFVPLTLSDWDGTLWWE